MTFLDLDFCYTWRLDQLEALKTELDLDLERLLDPETIQIAQWVGHWIPEAPRSTRQATSAFLILFLLLCDSGLNMTVVSNIPVGSGLGSSAAWSACLAASLLKSHDLDTINRYALLAEKVMHEKTSGLDNTVCTFGGTHLYTKGNPSTYLGWSLI